MRSYICGEKTDKVPQKNIFGFAKSSLKAEIFWMQIGDLHSNFWDWAWKSSSVRKEIIQIPDFDDADSKRAIDLGMKY